MSQFTDAVAESLKGSGVLSGQSVLKEQRCFIPTNNVVLDGMLHGGLLVGRVYELYGEPSVGKSTILYLIMAAWQAAGGIVVFVDAEGTFDAIRAAACGVIVNDIIYIEPGSFQDQSKATRDAISKIRSLEKEKAGKKRKYTIAPILVPWDSLASSPTSDEVTNGVQTGVAVKPKLIHSFLRGMTATMFKEKVTMVFINQVIDNIGVDFGPKTKTPTGRAVPFMASVRIEVKGSGQFKVRQETGGDPAGIGLVSSLWVAKSKLFAPFRSEKIIVLWDFDPVMSEVYTIRDYIQRHELKYNDTDVPLIHSSGNGWYTLKVGGGDGIRGRDADVAGIIINHIDFFKAAVLADMGS